MVSHSNPALAALAEILLAAISGGRVRLYLVSLGDSRWGSWGMPFSSALMRSQVWLTASGVARTALPAASPKI